MLFSKNLNKGIKSFASSLGHQNAAHLWCLLCWRQLSVKAKEQVIIKKIILFILSTGWLVPMWIGLLVVDSWFLSELLPRIYGEAKVNSFPYHVSIRQLFTVAGIWFTLVSCGWCAYFIFKDQVNGEENS